MAPWPPVLTGVYNCAVPDRPSDPDVDVTRVVMGAEEAAEAGPIASERYLVIEAVGAGGMGQVFRAYDPKLRREVALKRVLPRALGVEGEARLVREAQAMAQLNHPNVVSVYDVESEGSAVVVAMEFVPGDTLESWLTGEWTPEQIIAAHIQAGRGLAAAHAAGFVHRDFKPANVLVAGDENNPLCKVTDFGLAKPTGLESDQSSPNLVEKRDEVDLTALGTTVGTPRYMAPEQHDGSSPVDARADQYAFCVALWLALTGDSPFVGKDLVALARAKRRGPPPWPKGSSAPRRIADALTRGLQPEPDDRWPSMDDLLAELVTEPRRRRSGLAVAVAVAGLSIAGVLALREPEDEKCTGGAAELEPVWDQATSARVKEALVATEAGFADSTWARIEPLLNRWTESWVERHREICAATTIRGEQSAQAMDLRMTCLVHAKADLQATVTLLENADLEVVERAIDIVEALPRLEACDDVEALGAEVAPPPELRETVDELSDELRRAVALERAGKDRAALAIFEELGDLAAELDYPPMKARIAAAHADALTVFDHPEKAEALAREAFEIALEHGPRRVVIASGGTLMHIIGYRQHAFDQAAWIQAVVMPMARGLGDPFLLAGTHEATGSLLAEQGKFEEALREYERSLALFVETGGRDDHNTGTVLNNIARVRRNMGDYEGSLAEQREALEIWSRAYGEDHPIIAQGRSNIAVALSGQGKHADAEVELRAALDGIMRAFGSDSSEAAFAHGNLGIVLVAQGRVEEGVEHHRRALELKLGAVPPDLTDAAHTQTNLGVALLELGKPAEAEVEFRVAAKTLTEILGEDHPLAATSHSNVGSALEQLGKLEEAEQEHRFALEHLAVRTQPDHPLTVSVTTNLASVQFARGDLKGASETLAPVWALAEADKVEKIEIGRIVFLRAQLLLAQGGNRSEAIALARRAEAAYREVGQGYVDEIAEIEAWLSEHEQ